jgi:hypothetical protein
MIDSSVLGILDNIKSANKFVVNNLLPIFFKFINKTDKCLLLIEL